MGHPFLVPVRVSANASVVSQVPFLRCATEMYLGHPFFVVGMLPKSNCASLGMRLPVDWRPFSPCAPGHKTAERGL